MPMRQVQQPGVSTRKRGRIPKLTDNPRSDSEDAAKRRLGVLREASNQLYYLCQNYHGLMVEGDWEAILRAYKSCVDKLSQLRDGIGTEEDWTVPHLNGRE